MTLAELHRLDAGARFAGDGGKFPFRGRGVRVPTLAAVLEAFPGVPLNIEIKQDEPAIEHAVLDVLDRFAARGQVLLAAEEARIMARIRAAAPGVLTSFSAGDVLEFVTAWHGGTLDAYRPPGVALQIPPSFGDVQLVTAESVAIAHGMELEVHVWTIDDPVEMAALLDLGVDALMTDVPPVAARLLRERGLR
jgi:glycerophosphoryl diester phosphodiesterase